MASTLLADWGAAPPPPLAPTLNTPTVMRFCLFSVRHVKKDEKRYYEELLRYSREHLMLYPYHLSDVIVRGLRVTPFSYYCSVMADIMAAEKSYDALPNFTAADCKTACSRTHPMHTQGFGQSWVTALA